MNIADIISKDAVLDNVQASNKRELIQILSKQQEVAQPATSCYCYVKYLLR